MITLSILIPVFNEERTIRQLLTAVAGQSVEGVKIEVVVIDDASADATPAILHECAGLYTKLVTLSQNSGKGAAVIAGLRETTADYVLVQDADMEYSPSEYANLLKPVLNFGAEVVIGSRFLAPNWTRVIYFWHKAGNWVITTIFNLLNNTTFTDIYSGFLLFRRSLVSPLELACAGWAQQAEILSKVCPRARVIYEVSINYVGRTYAEGKKIRAHDAVPVIWTMLRERCARLFKPTARSTT